MDVQTLSSIMPSNAILFKTYTEGLSSDEKLQFQSEFTSRQRTSGLGIVLALLLGGLGAHKFYLKDTTAGIVYALCGTIGWIIIIPPIVIAILSIVDACRMAGEDKVQQCSCPRNQGRIRCLALILNPTKAMETCFYFI